MIEVWCDGDRYDVYPSMKDAVRHLLEHYAFDDVVRRFTIDGDDGRWDPVLVVDGISRRVEWKRV